MRHKKKRVLELHTGVQKKQNVLRNLLTSLVTHGQITTTTKKSKAVKAYADSFFSRLMRIQGMYDEAGAKRESIRYVKTHLYTEDAGKKVIKDLLPKYMSEEKKSGFVMNVKLGARFGDAAESILVRLI